MHEKVKLLLPYLHDVEFHFVPILYLTNNHFELDKTQDAVCISEIIILIKGLIFPDTSFVIEGTIMLKVSH